MAVDRSYRMAAAGAALLLAVGLAACGDKAGKGEPKAEATSQSVVEAAADPCAAVSGAYGEALCGDPDLQPLVGQVKERLVDAAGDVAVGSARQIADGQTQWLEATRIACGIGTGKIPLTKEQKDCVTASLRRRAQQASATVTQQGGYTFQAVEINRAQPITADIAADMGGAEFAPAAITKEIRFPRIEGDSPQIQRFNALMAQRPQRSLADATSEFVDYRVAYAGPELVSVRFTMSETAVGAIRPSDDEKVVTVVMATGEPLKETDVFSAPPARWKAELARLATRDLRRQLREMDPEFQLPAPEVLDTATKTKNWVITQDALIVLFPPESIGPHALGNFEVKIPWADLRALLNPAAPAPIKAPA
ncbi:MAG: DUF3298 domain-containing protein [Hyphomonadaceae bacterium]|nr:MAG: hypothetical protein FD160_3803 [Caulobacteraceae bacterium]MBT9446858.1 DUF3298 domain-containing protein [Hyphomonadaceae bacterium]TPW03053.1 MAG: hypothetical protein FD124_3157 [Alphaproteobacteria bacterium]